MTDRAAGTLRLGPGDLGVYSPPLPRAPSLCRVVCAAPSRGPSAAEQVVIVCEHNRRERRVPSSSVARYFDEASRERELSAALEVWRWRLSGLVGM